MAGSAAWAALSGLYATLAADAALTALAAVYDGPAPTDAPDPVLVAVGDNGDPSTDEASISGGQEWAGLGRLAKDERFTLRATVVARSGEADFAALRGSAKAVLDAVEAVLRANPDLGGTVMDASLTDVEVFQHAHADGARVLVTFAVACRARI